MNTGKPVSSGMSDREIEPAQAVVRMRAGALLIDVREDEERAGGMPDQAIGLPCARIMEFSDSIAADRSREIMLICADKVERSNLQRQVVHVDQRIGMAKTESARITLAALNPTIRIETHETRLVAANVEALLQGHDLVIDGADNFPTRYLLDAATRRLGIPLVYGAVHRFTGQISVFDPRRDDSPCYRCLFTRPPSAADAPNCSEAGVLGVMPGIIGMLQANEAIKLVLGQGRSLAGRLLCFDALDASFRELLLARDPLCPGCGSEAVFTGYEDIVSFCSDQFLRRFYN